MRENAQPLEEVLNESFSSPTVKKVVAEWRVDASTVRTVVSNYIREMGFDFIRPAQREVVFETIVYCLRNSRELKQMEEKAEREERMRKRSRHAE